MPKENQPAKAKLDHKSALSLNALEAVDFVSADQYVVNTPNRFQSGYSREVPHNQCHGGTLFDDAATCLIWAENQVSLGTG